MKPLAAAVLVAGGQGKRFGGHIRKQYLSLLGRPVLAWTVSAFEHSPSIGCIILVVPPEDVAGLQRRFSREKIKKAFHIVAGGKARADSVRQGLAAVPAEFRWIAVHDGVRPLVTPALIEHVLREARLHRAAIAACPSKETVKVAGRRQMIERTLPRESVWLAHTPQAFERGLLERAHRQGRRLEATDDAFLVERLGVAVKLVESPPENLKVTVPQDLKMAQTILRARRSKG